MVGTVTRLQIAKGFGFIRPDERGQPDRFFHRSSLKGHLFEELREGHRVSFEDEPSEKGARAGEVRVVGE